MTDPLIYGVGNEVLVLVVLFIVLIFLILYVSWGNYNFQTFTGLFRYFFGDDSSDPPSINASEEDGGRIFSDNEVCPICLGPYSLRIESSCGHMFCGPCMRTYIEHTDYIRERISCPLCRQRMTALFNAYTDEEKNSPPDSATGIQRTELNFLVNRFNRIASGSVRTFLHNIRDWPVLLRGLARGFYEPEVYLILRISLVVTVATVYVFSPVDAIPESVFGIVGLIDDILVVLFCMWFFTNVIRS